MEGKVLEPLFTYATAVEMIPLPNITALYNWLWRNRALVKPLYRRERFGRERGFLTMNDIILIRKNQYHEFEESCHSKRTYPIRENSPLASVFKRYYANA